LPLFQAILGLKEQKISRFSLVFDTLHKAHTAKAPPEGSAFADHWQKNGLHGRFNLETPGF
jgi:hypothetical protein